MANQGEQGARCSAVISRGPGSSALLKGKKRHSQEVWDVSCLLGKGREGKTNTHTRLGCHQLVKRIGWKSRLADQLLIFDAFWLFV